MGIEGAGHAGRDADGGRVSAESGVSGEGRAVVGAADTGSTRGSMGHRPRAGGGARIEGLIGTVRYSDLVTAAHETLKDADMLEAALAALRSIRPADPENATADEVHFMAVAAANAVACRVFGHEAVERKG
jgi:hypothetical protein